MATTNKGLNLPSLGDTGWNVPLNANTNILDKAFGAFTTIPSTNGVTDLTSDQVQNMCIKSTTSAFLANVTYRIPSGIAGQWVIQNQSATSAYTLTVSNVAGGTSVTIPIGTVRSIYSDGTNVVYADTPSAGDFVDVTVSGTLTLGGGNLTGVATQVEAEAGTSAVKVMTPLRVDQAITNNVGVANSALVKTALNAGGTAPIYACRAWAYASGITDSIITSGNINGITKFGTGRFTFTFATKPPTTNYVICTSIYSTRGRIIDIYDAQTINGFSVVITDSSYTFEDPNRIYVSVFW